MAVVADLRLCQGTRLVGTGPSGYALSEVPPIVDRQRVGHCPVCCEHFATDGTAELHWAGRSYGARHLDPHVVSALVQGSDGVWHMAGNRPAYVEVLCGEAGKPSLNSQAPAEVAS